MRPSDTESQASSKRSEHSSDSFERNQPQFMLESKQEKLQSGLAALALGWEQHEPDVDTEIDLWKQRSLDLVVETEKIMRKLKQEKDQSEAKYEQILAA